MQRSESMILRTISSTVTFLAPFLLKNLRRPQPAGTYRVDTEEEGYEGKGGTIFRSIRTLFYMRDGASVRLRAVDPADLDAALVVDRAGSPEIGPEDQLSRDAPTPSNLPQTRNIMSKSFRKKHEGPRLSREEAERQGHAARIAWETFSQPGAAVAFLNTFHDQLGGRPIDIAIASAAGLRAVQLAIAAAAPAPVG
jgi:hypothetical protein